MLADVRSRYSSQRRTRVAFALGGTALLLVAAFLHRLLLRDLIVLEVPAGDLAENVLLLHRDSSVGQTFRVPAEAVNLSAIDVLIFPPPGERRTEGRVILHLRSPTDNQTDLRTGSASVSRARSDAHTRFSFEPLDTTGAPNLAAVFEYESGSAEKPLLIRADRPRSDLEPRSDYSHGSATVNGEPADADLEFRLLTRGRLPFGRQVTAAALLGGLVLGARAAFPHRRRLSVFLLGFGLPAIFALPLLVRPSYLGVGDWDMNTTLATAASRALLAERTFPSWNPYLCGGTPLAAFPEAPIFSPFFGLSLLLGPVVGMKASILLHLAIAFGGMLVWLRLGWRRSLAAAVLGAAVVTFSSFVALHLFAGHSRKVAIAFLPWTLFFFHRAFATDRPRTLRWTAPAGASLALSSLGGSVYLTTYVAFFVLLTGITASLARRRRRPIVASVLTLLVGGLLAGMHLVPTAYSQSVLGPQLTASPGKLPPRALVDVFLDPNQSPYAVKFDGQSQQWLEYGAYVGVGPVLLAILGLLASPRTLAPWVTSGVIFLLGAFSPATQRWLEVAPVLGDLRNPQRMVVMVTVVVALAAAHGLDAIRRALTAGTEGKRTVGVTLGLFTGMLVAHLYFVNTETLGRTFVVPPPLPDTRPFAQGWARPYLEGLADTFPFTMENTAQNRGSLNRCSVASVRPSKELRLPEEYWGDRVPQKFRDQPYRGEAFLLSGDGAVEVISTGTHELRIHARAEHPGAVIAINENWHPGWRARWEGSAPNGRPDLAVVSASGIAALKLPPGESRVTLTYETPFLGLGLLASAAGLALALRLWWARS